MTRTPAPSAAPASTVPAVPAEDRAARRCVAALTARGATVAVAESLTAGQVTARLADVPGASTVLRGAVVAYATPLKHEVLGVDVGLLSERGPVDEDVATTPSPPPASPALVPPTGMTRAPCGSPRWGPPAPVPDSCASPARARPCAGPPPWPPWRCSVSWWPTR